MGRCICVQLWGELQETELHVLLRDIKKHLTKAEITDEALQILESIIMKVMIKISDLKHILDLVMR